MNQFKSETFMIENVQIKASTLLIPKDVVILAGAENFARIV